MVASTSGAEVAEVEVVVSTSVVASTSGVEVVILTSGAGVVVSTS